MRCGSQAANREVAVRVMRDSKQRFLLTDLINVLRLHAREVGSSGQDDNVCRGIANDCTVMHI